MSLYDKFGIIENHLIQDNKTLFSKLENYFENYLNSDIKIVMFDFINQAKWFQNINFKDLSIDIENLLKNHLFQRRNIIKNYVKKENYSLTKLNYFIKNFIHKIEYIDKSFKSNNIIIKEAITQLSNLIISDSIILLFIEEELLNDSNNFSNVESLIKTIKYISKYDNNEIFNKIATIFSNIFIKKIIDSNESPLPENIKIINKINQTIKYAIKLNNDFKFIKEESFKFVQPLYSLIINDLVFIIKNNSLNEILFLFEKVWNDINNILIIIKKENDTEYIKYIDNIINSFLEQHKNIISNRNSMTFYDEIKYMKIYKYIYHVIQSSSNKDIIDKKISKLCSSHDIINNLNVYINNSIEQSDVKDINFIINLILPTIKNKDIFIETYYEYLIKRLTTKFTEIIINNLKHIDYIDYFDIEMDCINTIQLHVGQKLTYKLYKVIKDIIESIENNKEYMKINNTSNIISVITTSYNNWSINHEEGIMNTNDIDAIINTQLGKYLSEYNTFYENKYEGKKILNWYPHFGEVNITYNNKNIIMLPIQFMVLELFDKTDCLLITDILKTSFLNKYSNKFANDIIKSLLYSKILLQQNNNISLSCSDDFNTNLIEIFFKISDYVNVWEQIKNTELASTRNEIICSNINHELKKKPLTKTQLFDVLYNKINVFELNNEILDNALKYMQNMDYIKTEADNYVKIVY